MYLCLSCHRPSVIKMPLCHACTCNMEQGRYPLSPQQNLTQCLFAYNDTVRALVLNAKVNGNLAALACLIRCFVQLSCEMRIAQDASAIMPMPSSLWGRYRGRIDIAYHLAFHLAKAVKVPFKPPPLTLGWHIRKRAMVNANVLLTRDTPHITQAGFFQNAKPILVVDDLCTTGLSFAKLQAKLPREKAHLLAFAGTMLGS